MLEKGKTSLEDANRFLSSSDTTHDVLYFKPGDSRQGIELPGGYSTDIEDEYNAMQRLYSETPSMVVEPVQFVDEPEGYFMEYVECRNLQSVIGDDLEKYDIEYVLEQVSDFGRDIRDSGVPHGDIRASNFIITDESEVKAIDPAGIPEKIDAQTVVPLDQQAVNWDITDLNDYIIERVIEESETGLDAEEYRVAHPETEVQQF